MPDGEDPDSLIKSSGVKGFQKILGNSVSLFDFIWNFYTQGREFKTPEIRAGVIKQLENEVAHVSNKDVQVHYKSQLRDRVSETFFKRKDFGYKKRDFQGRGKSQKFGRYVVPTRPPSSKNHAARIFTHALLAAVINHPHIFDGIEDVLCELTLSDVALERLRQNIMGILSDDPLIERKVLIEQLKNSGFTQEIGDICNESVYVHASFCSPSADEGDVQRYWLEYWNDGHSAKLGNEIQSGWKHVSCEEDEEKLRNLLLMKTFDSEE